MKKLKLKFELAPTIGRSKQAATDLNLLTTKI